MPLSVGTRLGPYVIEASLGAGGMGEVYLAKDARLDRKVALKVLPSHYALDHDRANRFMKEAKAASALSHPNVRLPGVGPKLAARILEYRQKSGAFKSVSELMNVKITVKKKIVVNGKGYLSVEELLRGIRAVYEKVVADRTGVSTSLEVEGPSRDSGRPARPCTVRSGVMLASDPC